LANIDKTKLIYSQEHHKNLNNHARISLTHEQTKPNEAKARKWTGHILGLAQKCQS